MKQSNNFPFKRWARLTASTMINTLDEAVRQIRDFGVDKFDYTIKFKKYDDSETIIVEVKFREDLMRVLTANSNHVGYFPNVQGMPASISFNTMRGTDGNKIYFNLI